MLSGDAAGGLWPLPEALTPPGGLTWSLCLCCGWLGPPFPEQGLAHRGRGVVSTCHRWAQVTSFLMITDKELNQTDFIAEREKTDLLSDSTHCRHGSRPTLSRD